MDSDIVWPDGRRVPAAFGRHPHELQPSEGVSEAMAAENASSHRLTAAKARLMLHEGTVRGHPITEQQRKFFGAIAGGARPRGRR